MLEDNLSYSYRDEEIKVIHQRFIGFYDLLRGSIIVLVLLIIGAYMFVGKILDDYTTNVFTEAVGVIGTALILDNIYRRRADDERKNELVVQLKSPNEDFAREAFRLLEYKGWVFDGSLKKRDLAGVYLIDADLGSIDLQGVRLIGAKLQNSNFMDADIQNVDLSHVTAIDVTFGVADLSHANLAKGIFENCIFDLAKLDNVYAIDANFKNIAAKRMSVKNATLVRCNFSDAYLRGVIFQDCDLSHANFENASLWHADFTGANLTDVNFTGADLRDCTLPDGAVWKEGDDMSKFTESEKIVSDEVPF